MLAFLAAVTTTIEVSSAMALVTLRDPVLVAKQAAEVDLLLARPATARGQRRMEPEEQRALGVDPATRGRRIEEMVPLLRRLSTEDTVTHHGDSFDLDQVGIHPRPSRAIPVWMGGGGFESQGHPGEVSMRRAARLADGFKLMAPTGADVDQRLAPHDVSTSSPPCRDARSTSRHGS